jgi:hypothetical protein
MTADVAALHGFLERILGWRESRRDIVDRALRSIELAASRHAALVISGAGDLVPMARALHRRTFGADAPFVVCDPRRSTTGATVRSPANHDSGGAACLAARGGTLCMRARRLPRDFASIINLVRDPRSCVQLVVCWPRQDAHPLLVSPSPITVPLLRDRADELGRIIDEYAIDALHALEAPAGCFTDDDRAWVIEHATGSFDEIEKATLRIVALASSPSVTRAAAKLDMAHVSLTRWIERRETPATAAGARPLPTYLRKRSRLQSAGSGPLTIRGSAHTA